MEFSTSHTVIIHAGGGHTDPEPKEELADNEDLGQRCGHWQQRQKNEEVYEEVLLTVEISDYLPTEPRYDPDSWFNSAHIEQLRSPITLHQFYLRKIYPESNIPVHTLDVRIINFRESSRLTQEFEGEQQRFWFKNLEHTLGDHFSGLRLLNKDLKQQIMRKVSYLEKLM